MSDYRVRFPDIVLILFLLLISFLPWFFCKKEDGKNVSVMLNGQTVYVLSLSKNEELNIDGVGKVIIEDGFVYVSNMTCSDKICEKQGKIQKSGNSIVCAPNKLVVVVDGDEDVDAVVG